MTKSELIAALAGLPDDAQVLVRCVASSNNYDHMVAQAAADMSVGDDRAAELSTISDVGICEEDGPGAPAFATIDHTLEYIG